MKNLYLIVIATLLFSCTKTYKVKVIYCDPRLPKTIYVNAMSAPSTHDIVNKNVAVPYYKNEMNVCEIIVLQEIK